MFFKAKKSKKSDKCTSAHLAGAVATRSVAERRWIHRNQLELGMYVNELDVPWDQTSFMFQGFIIDSHDTLRAVQEVCQYVNVQTEKLAKYSSKSTNRLIGSARRVCH